MNKDKKGELHVYAISEMSAGKSTLINAMLGMKLIPSKQEPCTAILTQIKDTECNDNWQAEAYSKDNRLLETHENLTYSTMERLNSDKNVSSVKVAGNISFASSEINSVVLIDTPSLYNRGKVDVQKIHNAYLDSNSKDIVFYIMECGSLGSDNYGLLHQIADSMNAGSKQNKERFVFVLNKMDDWRRNDDDITKILNKVRNYLECYGITNPNLFLTAALPALNIRLMQNGVGVDEDTLDETEIKVRKLNRYEDLHLETYAPLPESVRNDIKTKLDNAITIGDKFTEALIHTGIVSIEAFILQYWLENF